MINPSFDELKKIDDSRYLIVVAVAQRARRIVQGSDVLIETKNKIPVTIAIEEVMEGKVSFDLNEEE